MVKSPIDKMVRSSKNKGGRGGSQEPPLTETPKPFTEAKHGNINAK